MRKKLDLLEQLIEVSDKCMTMHPTRNKDGSLNEYPCNCRKNVMKLLNPMVGTLRNFIEGVDHIGSGIYDWQRNLKQFAKGARRLLRTLPHPDRL